MIRETIENEVSLETAVNNPEKELYLEVGTVNVTSFFQTAVSVKLPDYQRPYVWNEEKVEQLLQDFEDHFFTSSGYNNQAIHYYLGGVLLYEKNSTEYEIIDGQQRITTLLILDHYCNDANSYLNQGKWNLEYSSLLSKATIKHNFKFLKESSRSLKIKRFVNDIFSKLVFTVIKTNSEDEAFTFFDSQNNRGVSLSPVDFLKSYHLRELKGQEDLQRVFAKQWDSNNKGQFLNELFNLILWRSRNWKGKELLFENKDSILKSFQKKSIKIENNENIRLYPNIFNALANQLSFDPQSGITVQPTLINLQAKASLYPFAIRQPIQKGIGFFLYTEKYFAIYNELFSDSKYYLFTEVYKKLVQANSVYLRVFFKLAAVVYYDKFKENKLVEFALWLDYLLGSYRMVQKSIVQQTVIKILRDQSQNLLDVIEMAYRPEEVFEFIKTITDKHFYKIDDSDKEWTNNNNGVRNTYRKANLAFFENIRQSNKDLISKQNWINGFIECN